MLEQLSRCLQITEGSNHQIATTFADIALKALTEIWPADSGPLKRAHLFDAIRDDQNIASWLCAQIAPGAILEIKSVLGGKSTALLTHPAELHISADASAATASRAALACLMLWSSKVAANALTSPAQRRQRNASISAAQVRMFSDDFSEITGLAPRTIWQTQILDDTTLTGLAILSIGRHRLVLTTGANQARTIYFPSMLDPTHASDIEAIAAMLAPSLEA